MEVKEEIKLNSSWKAAFLAKCHLFIGGLIGVAVSLYFIITGKNDFLLQYLWIPCLLLSILEVVFGIYHMYSLTKGTTTHLFISVFPIQIIDFSLQFIWFSYLIGLIFFTFSSLGPGLIFACFIFICLAVDSLSVLLILSAILAKAETLTRFICKCWIIRDIFVLFISICCVAFSAYIISLGNTSIGNIFFLIFFIVELVLFAIYFKLKYFEKKSFKPKPLEEKLPERQTLNEAYLLMVNSSKERQEGAGAA